MDKTKNETQQLDKLWLEFCEKVDIKFEENKKELKEILSHLSDIDNTLIAGNINQNEAEVLYKIWSGKISSDTGIERRNAPQKIRNENFKIKSDRLGDKVPLNKALSNHNRKDRIKERAIVEYAWGYCKNCAGTSASNAIDEAESSAKAYLQSANIATSTFDDEELLLTDGGYENSQGNVFKNHKTSQQDTDKNDNHVKNIVRDLRNKLKSNKDKYINEIINSANSKYIDRNKAENEYYKIIKDESNLIEIAKTLLDLIDIHNSDTHKDIKRKIKDISNDARLLKVLTILGVFDRAIEISNTEPYLIIAISAIAVGSVWMYSNTREINVDTDTLRYHLEKYEKPNHSIFSDSNL